MRTQLKEDMQILTRHKGHFLLQDGKDIRSFQTIIPKRSCRTTKQTQDKDICYRSGPKVPLSSLPDPSSGLVQVCSQAQHREPPHGDGVNDIFSWLLSREDNSSHSPTESTPQGQHWQPCGC